MGEGDELFIDRDGIEQHEREEAAAQELPSQVHLVGPDITVGTVQRQRCVWCGAMILEYDLANVSVQLQPGDDPENPPRPAVWPSGSLVLMTGTFPQMTTTIENVEHPRDTDSFAIPENSCLGLDPEITR